ncbi:peptidoglycan bridge formation glycyltransferase FemA/FemB family protein [Salinicoccus siamensis]|uniref:Lipid II:glycine glycyltransferase n=1 Tax=Salinicoccus siamensis TaxID=381830 RepID=A0ABV5Z3C2_9STAP
MLKLINLTEEEHNQFIEHHPNGDLLQLTDWAQSKRLTGWYSRRFAVSDGDQTVGAAVLMFKRLPKLKQTLCYASRGFVCDYDDEGLVEFMLEEALKIAKEEKAYVLKIDPDIPLETHGGTIEFLKQIGFRHRGLKDGMSKDNIQPRQTMVTRIDKSDEDLLGSFERNNRTRVRNAIRKGTKVYKATREDLPIFVELMKVTGKRDGFLTRDITYFESLYDNLHENGHMELFLVKLVPKDVSASLDSDISKVAKELEKAQKRKDSNKKENQLKDLANRAEKLEKQKQEIEEMAHDHPEGIILSGALLAHSGHKAYYLYGASSDLYREYLPNHHMQYEMMKYARDVGALTYDFGGVSVDPPQDSGHFGLWQFKKVWGTEVSEKVGEFDYVINRPLYTLAEVGVPLFQKGKVKLNQQIKAFKERK